MSKERGLLNIIVSSPLTRSAVHKDISQDDLTVPRSKIHNVIPVHISQCMDERKHFSCTKLRCLSHTGYRNFSNMCREDTDTDN